MPVLVDLSTAGQPQAYVLKRNSYPLSVDLVALEHHLKLFVDLTVFGLGTWCQLVLGLRFRTVGTHNSVLVLLLIKCLQVSVDQLMEIGSLWGFYSTHSHTHI